MNNPTRIMIVDDDPSILYLTEYAFELSGEFQITTCQSRKEALVKLPHVQPELILLDINMPGPDGLSTLKQIQKFTKSQICFVIVMSGDMSEELQVQYMNAGAVGCLDKPFVFQDFVASVLKIWRLHSEHNA